MFQESIQQGVCVLGGVIRAGRTEEEKEEWYYPESGIYGHLELKSTGLHLLLSFKDVLTVHPGSTPWHPVGHG